MVGENVNSNAVENDNNAETGEGTGYLKGMNLLAKMALGNDEQGGKGDE